MSNWYTRVWRQGKTELLPGQTVHSHPGTGPCVPVSRGIHPGGPWASLRNCSRVNQGPVFLFSAQSAEVRGTEMWEHASNPSLCGQHVHDDHSKIARRATRVTPSGHHDRLTASRRVASSAPRASQGQTQHVQTLAWANKRCFLQVR